MNIRILRVFQVTGNIIALLKVKYSLRIRSVNCTELKMAKFDSVCCRLKPKMQGCIAISGMLLPISPMF